MTSLGYIVKDEIDRFPDLSYTAMNKIQAKDVRNGMWCIHNKSGFTGQVIKCHQIKSGKHGHTKCVYELRYPHNNKIARESCSAKTFVNEAIINRIEYQLSYIETEQINYKKLNYVKQMRNKLIFGYIRNLKKCTIPKDIINICFDYYFIAPDAKYDFICMDDEFNELVFPVPNSKDNQKLFNKVNDYIENGILDNNDCYVVILECPKINKKNVVMIQIVFDLCVKA